MSADYTWVIGFVGYALGVTSTLLTIRMMDLPHRPSRRVPPGDP